MERTQTWELVRKTFFRAILPPILGGIGATVAVTFPDLYRAICATPFAGAF